MEVQLPIPDTGELVPGPELPLGGGGIHQPRGAGRHHLPDLAGILWGEARSGILVDQDENLILGILKKAPDEGIDPPVRVVFD